MREVVFVGVVEGEEGGEVLVVVVVRKNQILYGSLVDSRCI